jgi:hypothetical protein
MNRKRFIAWFGAIIAGLFGPFKAKAKSDTLLVRPNPKSPPVRIPRAKPLPPDPFAEKEVTSEIHEFNHPKLLGRRGKTLGWTKDSPPEVARLTEKKPEPFPKSDKTLKEQMDEHFGIES